MVDPIEVLAHKVAVTLKRWNPDITAHVEDIRYGAAYFINYYSVIIVSLIIGLFSGEFLWTGVSLVAFGILRKYTGGYHFKSLTGCAIVTIVLLSLIPHLRINTLWVQSLNIISILLIVLFVESKTNRYMGAMLIMTNVLFASPTISLAFFVQALTTIKLSRGGERT